MWSGIAVLAESFTVTIALPSDDSIQVSPAGGSYEAGSVVTFTATSNTRTFQKWYGDVPADQADSATLTATLDPSLDVTLSAPGETPIAVALHNPAGTPLFAYYYPFYLGDNYTSKGTYTPRTDATLLLVNSTSNDVTATLSIPDMPATYKRDFRDHFNPAKDAPITLPIHNNSFTLTLAPYETRVYR